MCLAVIFAIKKVQKSTAFYSSFFAFVSEVGGDIEVSSLKEHGQCQFSWQNCHQFLTIIQKNVPFKNHSHDIFIKVKAAIIARSLYQVLPTSYVTKITIHTAYQQHWNSVICLSLNLGSPASVWNFCKLYILQEIKNKHKLTKLVLSFIWTVKL